jgi:dTMP kinase
MKIPFYIMLEGGENVGKGTQLKSLKNYFLEKEIPFRSIIEPGETEPGKLIRNILLERKDFDIHPLTELFLYEADRTETFHKIIIPSLENKISILEDRSWPSTYAYQDIAGGLNKTHDGLVDYLNKAATFCRTPDLLFIINGDPSKLLKKTSNKDRMESKGEEFHEKVNRGYLEVAKKFPEISIIIPYQEGAPEKMQQEIRFHIKERLGI